MIATLAALPVALLMLGAPVFVVFLAGAVATLAFVLPTPDIVIQQAVFGALSTYALLAVPFFIFAGELMRRSGIADRLIAFVLAVVGRVPGSMGLTTLGAGTMLGAISGSSPATVAALGKTLYPGLLKAGYGSRDAAGLLASSASISIVIPPSIAMILYGAAAEQSIAKLFVAGIPAGLFIAAVMAVIVAVRGLRNSRSAVPPGFELGRAAHATLAAVPSLLMPVFVLGGIMLGLFSPTEAGGFACAYAIIVGRILKTLSWGEILDAAAESAILTAQVLVIVAAAGLFSYILTTQQVPQALIGFIQELGLNRVAFLLAVNLLLLLVGCLLDPTSAILVLTPLLLPLAVTLGVDPIHFGIIMTVNLSIGMFTPPFGLNVFVAQSVLGLRLQDIFIGVLPYALAQIFALAVITYWPALSLAPLRFF